MRGRRVWSGLDRLRLAGEACRLGYLGSLVNCEAEEVPRMQRVIDVTGNAGKARWRIDLKVLVPNGLACDYVYSSTST